MNLLEKSDDEIIVIANPIWDNLVKTSNMKDYGGFTKDLELKCYLAMKVKDHELNNSLVTIVSDELHFLFFYFP